MSIGSGSTRPGKRSEKKRAVLGFFTNEITKEVYPGGRRRLADSSFKELRRNVNMIKRKLTLSYPKKNG